jgi:hypothetical protein
MNKMKNEFGPRTKQGPLGKGDEYKPLPIKSDDAKGSLIKNQVCSGGNDNWMKKI